MVIWSQTFTVITSFSTQYRPVVLVGDL